MSLVIEKRTHSDFEPFKLNPYMRLKNLESTQVSIYIL
jgi:hypothetical protein